MVFVDKMNDIISVLENDGLIIFPSDTIWMMAASIKSEIAANALHQIKSKISEHPFTIMFSDIRMMKKHLPDLHPRVETLMTYHKKPLSIIDNKWAKIPNHIGDEHKTLSFHLVRDDFTQTIIDLLGNPILTSSIRMKNLEFVDNFNDISEQYLSAVNYICKHKRQEAAIGTPSVIASYDNKGNLTFYRE